MKKIDVLARVSMMKKENLIYLGIGVAGAEIVNAIVLRAICKRYKKENILLKGELLKAIDLIESKKEEDISGHLD